jgi:hypothetical protein
MAINPEDQDQPTPQGRYLALAAAVFIVAALLLAGLWQAPRLFPTLTRTATFTPVPTATATASATATATATPSPTLTPTPAITHPILSDLAAQVDDEAGTITFQARAEVPPGQGIAEALLWYDTEAGHQLRRLPGSPLDSLELSYQLDVASEGLTRTVTTTTQLDYWWLVRDTAGDQVRAGGTALLSPALRALVVTPAPPSPPLDFTWSISDSQHFQFHYMPGTAAERDLPRLGAVAEDSLQRISTILQTSFDGQMNIYLVPRVFWQGGATYGDKVQLISYLDRNYTGVDIWSYFTHEGTHALAQDFIVPKDSGGPDGVLVEGLAVWASGGHYRTEPVDEWAAVIAASDQYIPLPKLRAGPFYDFQHEISYLEGGSFVGFLIERYGLDRFKELYGQETGEATHDEDLVQSLYNRSYAQLEQDWLDYLAGLEPTPEQAQTLWLQVRSFDLMRRYETELDPNARILPPKPPTEWLSDTLKIFMGRLDAPLNEVLETALIAAQDKIYGIGPAANSGPDPAGAAALLDDIEAALDAKGELTRPSLQARQAIVDLLAAQDRAVLRADTAAFRATLTPAYGLAEGDRITDTLQVPFTAYRQEVVRLDLAGDGLSARGLVLLHAQVADRTFAGDGQLFAITLDRTADGWFLAGRQPAEPVLSPPPPAPENLPYFVWRTPYLEFLAAMRSVGANHG